MTLFIAAGSWPFEPFELVFEPAGRRQPDDRRQVERDDGRGCGSRWPSPNTRAISACAELAPPARSANGFNVGTTKAAFGSLTPSMIEKPMIAKMFWTCGIDLEQGLDAPDRLAGA